MWTQIAPFMEAETAYRRERIIAAFPHTGGQRGRLPRVRPNGLRRHGHLGVGSALLRAVPKHVA